MDGTTEVKTWRYNLPHPEFLPEELTVRLPDAVKIGGLVRDLKASKNQAADIEKLRAWGIEPYEDSIFRRTA
jgi:hypothetical protein